jgi:hypothetical protein
LDENLNFGHVLARTSEKRNALKGAGERDRAETQMDLQSHAVNAFGDWKREESKEKSEKVFVAVEGMIMVVLLSYRWSFQNDLPMSVNRWFQTLVTYCRYSWDCPESAEL